MIVLLRAQQQNTERKDAPLFAYSPVAYAAQNHPTPERALGEILPVESGHLASPMRLEQSATPVNWHCSTVRCTGEMDSNSITSSPIFVPFVNKTFDRDNEPYSDKALNEWESKGTKCITHPNGFADDLASRVWP
ncbi:unnamed protein product [Caretta caretta]